MLRGRERVRVGKRAGRVLAWVTRVDRGFGSEHGGRGGGGRRRGVGRLHVRRVAVALETKYKRKLSDKFGLRVKITMRFIIHYEFVGKEFLRYQNT